MKPAATAADLISAAISEPTIKLTPVPAREEPAPAPAVLPTPAVRLVVNRIAYGVKRGAPLVIVPGEHGTGKTTSARLYASTNPRALYWEVKPEYTAREIVADLCQKLGINAGESWRVRTSVLIDHLTEHPYVILLDEAQRLDYKALDMLKYVADSAGITIVLLGSPWLERIIDRHTDIASRAWVRVKPQVLDVKACTELFQDRGYSAKTLKAIHDVTRGVMRSITALLDHLDEGLKTAPGMTRADLTPDHVRAVAEEVLS